MILRLSALVTLLAIPAGAQDALSFVPGFTTNCLQENGLDKPNDIKSLRRCIGVSAEECMTQSGGDTTYGMGFCLEQELGYWDGLLNERYNVLRAQGQAQDATRPDEVATLDDLLRDMQRAWIAFRDARCSFEAAQWQGGTGAGPAFLACMMQMTGEQALYLSFAYPEER